MSYDPSEAKSIFLQAMELPSPSERMAYVQSACGDRPQLQERVNVLLKTALDPDSLLDQPAAAIDTTQTVRPDVASLDFLSPCDVPGSLGRLATYPVLELIGRGGMGIVLRAMDTKLHRVVAIKVLAPEFAGNPQARKRFLREAQAAAAVSHDHVVTIHAVDDDEKLPLIVMECIVGQSLQQKIDKVGALRLTEILRIGMQTAAGLAAAHSQGLVHRDVKPANILLENGVERVKLTDFGLARMVDDASVTQSGVIAGTPQYMSPEQARGDAIDHRSDLFSLGCVMYAMCAGHAPFRASTTMGVLKRVCDESPRPIHDSNPDIPHWLSHVIDKLLAKSPDQRFQTAGEVAELLRQCLAHCQQPIQVPLPSALAALSDSKSSLLSSAKSDAAIRKPASAIKYGLTAGLVMMAIAVCLWFAGPSLLLIARNRGQINLDLQDTDARLVLKKDGQQFTHERTSTFDVAPGRYQLEIQARPGRRLDRLSFAQQSFTGQYHPLAAMSATELQIHRGEVIKVTADFSDYPLDLNGIWETSQRWPFEFSHWPIKPGMKSVPIKGKYVATGSFQGSGAIDATLDIDARTIEGSFVSGTASGRINLVVSPDGNSIEGTYGWRRPDGTDEPVTAHSWSVRRREKPTEADSSSSSAVASHSSDMSVEKTPASDPEVAKTPPAFAEAPFDASQARRLQDAWGKYLGVPVQMTNSLGMKFQLIPPGKFQMGSTNDELAQLKQEVEQLNVSDFEKFCALGSGPRHVVELSQPFYLGTYEVTIAQYRLFLDETKYVPSAEQVGNPRLTWKLFVPDSDPAKQPVCGVSWEDAKAFCKWLGDKTSTPKTQPIYDLPTEAQWEYACRAGSQTLWSFGNDVQGLSEYAIYGLKGTPYPASIGLRRANAFGLFDMHGNVDEWCLDWHNHQYYSRSPLVDPQYDVAPNDAASGRVARGGAWNADAWWSRSTTRAYDFPTSPNFSKGFRVVRKIPAKSAAKTVSW